MLKLMKYEFRKQMFSKLVMGIVLACLVAIFLFMNYTGNEDGVETTLAIMGLLMTISIFYVAIECITIYEKDLSTRQSYMLFLVPQTSKNILGAKMIAAILQILFTLVMFVGVLALCFSLYIMKFEGVKELLEGIKQIAEEFLQIKIDVPLVLQVMGEIVIVWVFVVMLGIFIVTAVNTVLNRSKVGSILAIILYFVCYYLVVQLGGMVQDVIPSDLGKNIFAYAFMIGIDLLFFFGTSWMIDKKLSV